MSIHNDNYLNDNLLEDIEELILEDEEDFLDSNKIHNMYYIGACIKPRNEDTLLLSCAITPQSLFKYKFNDVREYLHTYGMSYSHIPKVNIMKLYIIDDVCTVVLKTHWLRLIQRHMKKLFKEKQQIIKMRRSLISIRHFEIHGKYIYGLNVLPSIYGMMKLYNR